MVLTSVRDRCNNDFPNFTPGVFDYFLNFELEALRSVIMEKMITFKLLHLHHEHNIHSYIMTKEPAKALNAEGYRESLALNCVHALSRTIMVTLDDHEIKSEGSGFFTSTMTNGHQSSNLTERKSS